MPLLNPNLLPSLIIGDAIDHPLTGKLDNKLISWQEDLMQQQAAGAASHMAGTAAPGSTAGLLARGSPELSWWSLKAGKD